MRPKYLIEPSDKVDDVGSLDVLGFFLPGYRKEFGVGYLFEEVVIDEGQLACGLAVVELFDIQLGFGRLALAHGWFREFLFL